MRARRNVPAGLRDGRARNTSGAGLCLVGNYDENELNPVTLAALGELLAHGVRVGWWTAPTITQVHRDFKATACPGR